MPRVPVTPPPRVTVDDPCPIRPPAAPEHAPDRVTVRCRCGPTFRLYPAEVDGGAGVRMVTHGQRVTEVTLTASQATRLAEGLISILEGGRP